MGYLLTLEYQWPWARTQKWRSLSQRGMLAVASPCRNLQSDANNTETISGRLELVTCNVSIVTEPGKVKGYLLSKILPDVIQRLVVSPTGPLSPVSIQDLPQIQRLGGHWCCWQLKISLQRLIFSWDACVTVCDWKQGLIVLLVDNCVSFSGSPHEVGRQL